jgi:choline dehydrogenase-like flavoprotein
VRDQYDYIIVGAGSAGCVIANKLSADPSVTVLLIESGPDHKNFFLDMPRGVGVVNNVGSKFNWSYAQAHTGGNRPSERWFKGKGLGGSSSVNGMVYMRGSPRDYDRWAESGCLGWSWKEVEAEFKQLEDHELGLAASRGSGGPLHITIHPKGDPLCEAIIKAAGEMGVQRAEDINDPKMTVEGSIGYQPATIWRGKRFSAAHAFIDPIRERKNLDVVIETTVRKIVLEGRRAVGVRLRDKGAERSIGATREVILSGGAIETPKLLQLSGIGPARLLETFGIAVVKDAPEVGRNLREHRHFDIKFRVKSHSQNKNLGGWRVIFSMLRYLLSSTGPMTHCVHEIGGFVKTEPGLPHADMQFNFISVSATSLASAGKVKLEHEPGITFLGYYTRPKSQGELRIQSADPDALPYINANHLDTEVDRSKAVAVVHWMRRLSQQPALKHWIVQEIEPGPGVATPEEILNQAMQLGGPCFHICGTARMGADDGAVVDPRLKVRGVEGLRIADTSIMPTLVSGNTNGPAMMVGLRAARFIMEDNRASELTQPGKAPVAA